MKKVKDGGAIIICVIAVLIIVVLLVVKANNSKDVIPDNPKTNVEVKNEEFVKVQVDGTRENTSDKLKETKTVDGLEISNIHLTEAGGMSLVLADVKNNTSETKGDISISIIALDKNGKEMSRMGGYIDKVKPGATVQLNASVTADFANAWDIKIEKK